MQVKEDKQFEVSSLTLLDIEGNEVENLNGATYVYNDHIFGYLKGNKRGSQKIIEAKDKKTFSFTKVDDNSIACKLPKLKYEGSTEHKAADLLGYSRFDKDGKLINPNDEIESEIAGVLVNGVLYTLNCYARKVANKIGYTSNVFSMYISRKMDVVTFELPFKVSQNAKKLKEKFLIKSKVLWCRKDVKLHSNFKFHRKYEQPTYSVSLYVDSSNEPLFILKHGRPDIDTERKIFNDLVQSDDLIIDINKTDSWLHFLNSKDIFEFIESPKLLENVNSTSQISCSAFAYMNRNVDSDLKGVSNYKLIEGLLHNSIIPVFVDCDADKILEVYSEGYINDWIENLFVKDLKMIGFVHDRVFYNFDITTYKHVSIVYEGDMVPMADALSLIHVTNELLLTPTLDKHLNGLCSTDVNLKCLSTQSLKYIYNSDSYGKRAVGSYSFTDVVKRSLCDYLSSMGDFIKEQPNSKNKEEVKESNYLNELKIKRLSDQFKNVVESKDLDSYLLEVELIKSMFETFK